MREFREDKWDSRLGVMFAPRLCMEFIREPARLT